MSTTYSFTGDRRLHHIILINVDDPTDRVIVQAHRASTITGDYAEFITQDLLEAGWRDAANGWGTTINDGFDYTTGLVKRISEPVAVGAVGAILSINHKYGTNISVHSSTEYATTALHEYVGVMRIGRADLAALSPESSVTAYFQQTLDESWSIQPFTVSN